MARSQTRGDSWHKAESGRRQARRERALRAADRKALDQLNDSIEAAEKALKDLRAELSRGSRTLLKDVDSGIA